VQNADSEAEIVHASDINNKSVAVLPFENRSNDKDDAYFADGVQDGLLTRLAKISALDVISRTSVMGYRDTDKKIPDIAKELGVAVILEGAVQRAGKRVRITVQLIDGATDKHLWAQDYDRELTTDNLFEI
jgi:TolB-like protein